MRNAFTNKMSTYIKISKSQLTKIIRSGRFLGKTLGILGGKISLDQQGLMIFFPLKYLMFY